MKILILYFSAVGATKEVAKRMAKYFTNHEVDCYSIEEPFCQDLSSYDALIVGTPVHHAEPAKLLMKVIDELPVQTRKIPTFVFNTKGLAACHTNRILAKQLLSKNLITVYEADYVAPASDGALILPQMKRFFRFEKGIEAKIAQDCTAFLALVASLKEEVVVKLPPFRFSSVMNAPNKFGSGFVTLNIRVHRDACTKCGLCISRCPYDAIHSDEAGYPMITKSSCTNCYRCIHHCPTRALGLWKKKHLKVLAY
ncbi:MAG: EFR1 family ferrodoxin [Turicibacter sp.]|nr:EFR1 family ferrodoxin [Turicibacter sp.]